MKHIRDPLYGYISVSDAELGVIGTPEVQRLRRVHQLGLSSAVYPGATHMRFEHSLGVMHLAGQMATALDLPDDEVTAYRLAGLLHDTGHAPYSHAIEGVMERDLGISHEENSCRIVDALDERDVLPNEVDVDLIKAAILGKSECAIVAGAVDVDRMDYLRRDAFETGLEHGNIDTQSIIKFAELRDGEVVFNHKSLQALEGLFTARFHMTKSIYEHHTSKIVERMLFRAVDYLLETGDVTAGEVLAWDDFQLHAALMDSEGVAGRLFRRVANRNLYKRALMLGEDDVSREELVELDNELADVRATEREIAGRAGVSAESVLVDPPSTPTGSGMHRVRILWGDDVRRFDEVSGLPSTLTDSEWRTATLGVYAPEEHVEAVEQAAQTVLFG